MYANGQAAALGLLPVPIGVYCIQVSGASPGSIDEHTAARQVLGFWWVLLLARKGMNSERRRTAL